MSLPPEVARFDDAQRRTIAMTRDVLGRLEAGMSARDLYELAETRLEAHGFTGWYHAPEVTIGGAPPRLLPFPSPRRKLQPGDLVTIDLAPAGPDAYGDFGTTVCYGAGDAPPVLEVARTCVRGVCGFASRWKTVGELFVFAKAWAVNRRMHLHNRECLGHRVLGPEEVPGPFPGAAHVATFLRRYQVRRLNPNRLDGLYAVRPVVRDHALHAAFEEIVYVHEDTKWVLGRDRVDHAGT